MYPNTEALGPSPRETVPHLPGSKLDNSVANPQVYLPSQSLCHLGPIPTQYMMSSMYHNTKATSLPPTEAISSFPALELNSSVVGPQPGFPASPNPWTSSDPISPWPYPPSQYDHRCWGWAAGSHPFLGAQGPAFPTYPEIPSPWIKNRGYTDIPNLQPDVSLPSNRSVEAPRPDTVIHKDMPTDTKPETSHSNQRPDTQNRPITFECKWDGCTHPGTFAVGTSLWRHIQAHIGPDWYKCSVPGCGKTFDLGRKDKYNAHIRLVHRDMADNLLESPSLLTPA